MTRKSKPMWLLMATCRLIALPEHLRPSWSAAGLRKGNVKKADRLGDRIYLTDIGEAVYSAMQFWAASSTNQGQDNKKESIQENRQKGRAGGSATWGTLEVTIQLKWRKSYFPWKIIMGCNGLEVVLEGIRYGESTWSGAITLTLEGEDGAIRDIIEDILSRLHHPPWESKYWDQQMWSELFKRLRLTQNDISKDWKDICR